MEEYMFPNRPQANPKSVIAGAKYRFTLINDRVLRLEWAEDGVFEDRASTFALFRDFPTPKFQVEDNPDQLEILNDHIHLTYDKKKFSANGLYVVFLNNKYITGSEWRFGNLSDDGNQGGTARTLDNVDGRCDMGMGIISKSGYAVIDDSASMLFDGHGFVAPRRSGERFDWYLFSYGREFKTAMKYYQIVSGARPRVPRWCLGNWWSRYHEYSQDEYLGLMKKFNEQDIPLSVAVVDMDWHWVHESFVPHSGWTGYSWNTNLFPDPQAFAKALHAMNLKLTLNDHPHLGIHSHEDIYKKLAEVLKHDTSRNTPISFDPTSPEFMHAFFNIVHRSLETKGCDFWWIDWQQGTDSRIPGLDPLWLLNHFQYLDSKKTAGKSGYPMIFSRYAGPGSQRYPIGFSGDTFATWASLQFQPEFTATASNIGFGWWSHDLGGHMPGYRDDECTTRWIQYGVFSPIFRLHSTRNPWMSKEPWLYRPEHTLAMTEAMRLRHLLVPYLYSINATQEALPLPLVQPLYWSYPTREIAYSYRNEYFFGPSMVVSPIVTPRDARTNHGAVKTWIPPSRHVDMFTGTVYDGDRELTLYRPLHQIPVLLPEGAIVPLDAADVPENGCKNPDALEVLVVVGADGKFELLEDGRDDVKPEEVEFAMSRVTTIKFVQAKGRLSCVWGGHKKWKFRFVSADVETEKVEVKVGGEIFKDAKIEHCVGVSRVGMVVTVERAGNVKDEIQIELGADPQLAVLDHSDAWSEMLLDYQTGYDEKGRIWEILQSDQEASVKVGSLLALGMDEELLGPVIERLVADSRT